MKPPKKIRKLAAEELFSYAVKLLSLRASSSEELRGKLQRKAAQKGDVEAAIIRLKDIGYLNDERYAEGFASARLDNDGFGKFRILTDLRKRRIPSQLAQKVVDQTFEGTSEDTLVNEFIERRMASIAQGGVDDEKKLAAAYRKLRRAGFSSGSVIAALKRYAARPEELEEPPAEEEDDEEENSRP